MYAWQLHVFHDKYYKLTVRCCRFALTQQIDSDFLHS